MANEANGIRALFQEMNARGLLTDEYAEGVLSSCAAYEAEVQALRDAHQADRQKWAVREEELEELVKQMDVGLIEMARELDEAQVEIEAKAARIAELEKA